MKWLAKIKILLALWIFLMPIWGFGQALRFTEPLSRFCENLPVEITGICRDSYGQVWFSSRLGIYRFDGNHANLELGLEERDYLGIISFSSKELILLQEQKLTLFNIETKMKSTLDLKFPGFLNATSLIMEKGYGDTVYVLNENHCAVVQCKQGQLKHCGILKSNYFYCLEYDKTETFLSEIVAGKQLKRVKKISEILEHTQGHIISTTRYVDIQNETDQFEYMPIGRSIHYNLSTIKNIAEIQNSDLLGSFLWFDTSDILVNPIQQKLKLVFSDAFGYKWILTNSQLYINYPAKLHFRHLFDRKPTRDFIDLGNGEKICGVDNQLVWLGSKNDVKKSFPFRVYGMFKYNADSIFLTSDDQYCGWFNAQSGALTKIDKHNTKNDFFYHGAVKLAPGKLLVFGTDFVVLDVASGLYSPLKASSKFKMGVLRTAIQVNKNIFVFGGNSGLYTFNYQKNNFQKLASDFVTHVTLFNKNKIVFGTLGNGVKMVDTNGRSTVFLNSWPFKNGANNIYNVLVYNHEIWAGTSNGLVRYNLKNGEHVLYSPQNGTGNVEYNSPGAHVVQDTMLWFSGLNGISIVSPVDKNVNSNVQKIFFSEFRYFNKAWENANIEMKNNGEFVVRIPAGISDFEFAIGLQDFVNKENYELEYNIENLNKDWYSSKTYQNIRISNLGHGTHIIYLRLIDLSTGKEVARRKCFVIIKAFWYQTILAKVVFILLVLSLLVFLFFWNGNRIKSKAASENALLKAEMKALSAQIDPHFLANLMSSAQLRILQGTQSEAVDILSEYAQLMRKKFESGEHEFTTVLQEAELIGQYLDVASVVFGASLSAEVRVELDEQRQECVMPADLIQPLVENAIKHAWKKKDIDNKELLVVFARKKGKLEISVQDNGSGFDPSSNEMRKSSIRNIEKRLLLLSKMYHTTNQLIFEQNPEYNIVKVIIDCEALHAK